MFKKEKEGQGGWDSTGWLGRVVVEGEGRDIVMVRDLDFIVFVCGGGAFGRLQSGLLEPDSH